MPGRGILQDLLTLPRLTCAAVDPSSLYEPIKKYRQSCLDLISREKLAVALCSEDMLASPRKRRCIEAPEVRRCWQEKGHTVKSVLAKQPQPHHASTPAIADAGP